MENVTTILLALFFYICNISPVFELAEAIFSTRYLLLTLKMNATISKTKEKFQISQKDEVDRQLLISSKIFVSKSADGNFVTQNSAIWISLAEIQAYSVSKEYHATLICCRAAWLWLDSHACCVVACSRALIGTHLPCYDLSNYSPLLTHCIQAHARTLTHCPWPCVCVFTLILLFCSPEIPLL